MADPPEIPLNHPTQICPLISDSSPLSLFCQQYPRTQVLLRCGLFTDEWLLSFGVMYHYHVTHDCQRKPNIPPKFLDLHLSLERYQALSDAEASLLYLPITALPANLQISTLR